jgi:outer membrane lipoprotein-sorting protein
MSTFFDLRVKHFVVAVAFAAIAGTASAQNCDLNKTLSQMDTAAAQFKSLQADFVWDQYQAVVQEDDKQSGTTYFDKQKNTTIMAADIQQPAPKKLTFDGNNFTIYTPGTNEEIIYSVAKNKDMVEGFLTLGFGGSGTDLKKNWDVTCSGTETIDGVSTVKLDLVSKQDNVKNMFNKVTIWIDPTRAISLKQVFNQASGDKRTNTFTNIKLNANINNNEFKVKTAPNPNITRK